jgi:hypothetical protein
VQSIVAHVALAYGRLDQRRRQGRLGCGDGTNVRFGLGGLVFGDDVIELFDFFQEVSDVQEGVAIEANLYEGRLHAGKHASYFSLVDAAD